METTPREYGWFLEHPEIEEAYAGEYIAIMDDCVVAHGRDLKEVREAKKHRAEPLFCKVPVADRDQIV